MTGGCRDGETANHGIRVPKTLHDQGIALSGSFGKRDEKALSGEAEDRKPSGLGIGGHIAGGETALTQQHPKEAALGFGCRRFQSVAHCGNDRFRVAQSKGVDEERGTGRPCLRQRGEEFVDRFLGEVGLRWRGRTRIFVSGAVDDLPDAAAKAIAFGMRERDFVVTDDGIVTHI